MAEIIDFNEARKNREPKDTGLFFRRTAKVIDFNKAVEERKERGIKTYPSSYSINFGTSSISFSRSFAKELIRKANVNNDSVINAIANSHILSLETINNILEEKGALEKLNKFSERIVEKTNIRFTILEALISIETFDMLMEDDLVTSSVNDIVALLIHTFCTLDELRSLQERKILVVEPSVESFYEDLSTIYSR